MAGALGQFIQADPVRALVIDAENTQFRVLDPANHHSAFVLGEVVLVITKEGKMIPGQPFEKCSGFLFLFVIDARRGAVQLAQDLVYLFGNDREVADGNPNLMEDILERVLQVPEIFRITVSIDLKDNKRFVVRAGGLLLGGVQFLQLPIALSFHLQNRVLDRMGTNLPLVYGDTKGIDQKRDVRVQNKDNGVRRLPAVTLEIGVEYSNRRFFGRPLLQKLPCGKNCPIGVAKSSTDQLFKWDMRIMLLGKFADFLGFGFGNLLRESVSQLFKELILAGHCQRIHGRPQLV